MRCHFCTKAEKLWMQFHIHYITKESHNVCNCASNSFTVLPFLVNINLYFKWASCTTNHRGNLPHQFFKPIGVMVADLFIFPALKTTQF